VVLTQTPAVDMAFRRAPTLHAHVNKDGTVVRLPLWTFVRAARLTTGGSPVRGASGCAPRPTMCCQDRKRRGL